MNKLWLVSLTVFSILGAASPAWADGFSFSYSSGDYDSPRGWGPRGWGHRHGPWRRPVYRPVYYAPPPVYVAPPRTTVVYETAYVAPSIMANQSSPSYTDASGRLCREYQSVGTVGGRSGAVIYGTACLQPDGSWRVVD